MITQVLEGRGTDADPYVTTVVNDQGTFVGNLTKVAAPASTPPASQPPTQPPAPAPAPTPSEPPPPPAPPVPPVVVIVPPPVVIPPPQTSLLELQSDPVCGPRDAPPGGKRYDVRTDEDIHLVPWTLAGTTSVDVVNFFPRATPYNTKFGVHGQGTPGAHLILNGVTDSAGNRPQINLAGAATARSCKGMFLPDPANGEGLGGIVVLRSSQLGDAYATYQPKWLEVRNFELFGARAPNTFVGLSGAVIPYGSSAGIWCQILEDAVIENCIIHDNAFGVFTMAKDELFSQACKRITVRGNRIFRNGVPKSSKEHNLYIQCADPVIEGNYIGQTVGLSDGSSYKSRSSGEVFRYNYVEASARACDWVESDEQGTDGIVKQPDYATDLVYGNVFVNDFNLPRRGAFAPLHYGGDNGGAEDGSTVNGPNFVPGGLSYRKHLYFCNNTYVMRGTSAQAWRATLFDLSLAETTVDAWNNLIVMDGSTLWEWLAYSGMLNLRGNNGIFGTIAGDVHDGTPAPNPAKFKVAHLGKDMTDDPMLANLAARDFRLRTGSPALGLSTLPAGMPSIVVDRQPRLATNGWTARTASPLALGALETV